MPDADALAGRVIAITGPTAGIGRALAMEFARRGAELILLGRSVRKLEALDAELGALRRHSGGAIVPPVLAPLDLEKALAGDYDAIADAIEKRWGRLDGLRAQRIAAGPAHPDRAVRRADLDAGHARERQRGVRADPGADARMLRASQDASVLFTSSGVGRRGRAYWGAYAVSKFAVEGLVQVLAAELERTPRARQRDQSGQGAHRHAAPGLSVRGPRDAARSRRR